MENNFNTYLNTPMTHCIHKMFINSLNKKWYETYWAIDLHGTVMKSSYKDGDTEINYYPYAKETLQLLSTRDDIILIISSSSHPDNIVKYQEQFKNDDINFQHINCNPEISSRNGNFGYYKDKYYFNILFEDKAGFIPEIEWKEIYNLIKHYNNFGFLPENKWIKKY